MDVSILGMGRMGQALAGRLLDGGHRVTVWNRSPGRAGDLADRGAREASSVADATKGAEVVLTILANDEAVRQVALADDGVVAALADDAVYVDSSTVSPELSGELAGAAGAGRFVALPVLGAPAAVTAGTAVYLAGGDDRAVERLQPALRSLTETVRRYPEARLATTAKVASNFLLLSGIVALAESFAIGRAGGLSDDQLRGLLSESPLLAPGLRNRFEGVLTGEQEPWWSPDLGAKDARLGVDLAAAAGTALAVGPVVRDAYEAAAERHDGEDADIVTVAEPYRR